MALAAQQEDSKAGRSTGIADRLCRIAVEAGAREAANAEAAVAADVVVAVAATAWRAVANTVVDSTDREADTMLAKKEVVEAALKGIP